LAHSISTNETPFVSGTICDHGPDNGGFSVMVMADYSMIFNLNHEPKRNERITKIAIVKHKMQTGDNF